MNVYVKEVFGVDTKAPASVFVHTLWRVTEAAEQAGGAEAVAAPARAPPASSSSAAASGAPGSSAPAASSSSSTPAAAAAAASSAPPVKGPPEGAGSQEIVTSLVEQLQVVEAEGVRSGSDRESRYRFLKTRYEDRMPTEMRAVCEGLLQAVTEIDRIASFAVSEVTLVHTPGRQQPTAEAVSHKLKDLMAHSGVACDGVNRLNEELPSEHLYNTSSKLFTRLNQKVALASAALKICCGLLQGKMEVVGTAAQPLRVGDWGVDSGVVAGILRISEQKNKEQDELADIRKKLAEALRSTSDPDVLREERDLATVMLESLGVSEVVIHDVLRGVNAGILRCIQGDDAKKALVAAMATHSVDDITAAVRHAEQVGMKDVDGILAEAERLVDDLNEVSALKRQLQNAAQTRFDETEQLLQAILATNAYLKTKGIYYEKPPALDANGKVIPVTTTEHDLYLDHFNNNLWAPECTVLYEAATITYTQRKKSAMVSLEVQEMLGYTDEEFVRICGDDFCQDLLEKADECNYAGDDRKQLEKRVDTVFRVRLKVYFPQGDIKVLSVPQRIQFPMLHTMLAERYQEDNPELDEVAFKVHYLDADEDKIRITNDNDWRECLDMKRSQPSLASTLSATVAPKPGEFKLELHLDYHFGATTMVRRGGGGGTASASMTATPPASRSPRSAQSAAQTPSRPIPVTSPMVPTAVTSPMVPTAAMGAASSHMPPTGGGPPRRAAPVSSTPPPPTAGGAGVGMVQGAGLQQHLQHSPPPPAPRPVAATTASPPPTAQHQHMAAPQQPQAQPHAHPHATGYANPAPAPSQPPPPTAQPQGRWGAPPPQAAGGLGPPQPTPPTAFSSGGAVGNSPKEMPVSLPANSRWGRGVGGGAAPFIGLPEVPDESFIQDKSKRIDAMASRAAPPPPRDPYPNLSLPDSDEDSPKGPSRWDNYKADNPIGMPVQAGRGGKYRRSGAGRDELPKRASPQDAPRQLGEVRRVSAGAQGFRRIRDLPPGTPPDEAMQPQPAPPAPGGGGPQFAITGKAVK